jgi:hypothetical protein
MAARKIRDEADARTCLTAVKASGLDRLAWARREGVSTRSLGWWHSKIGQHVEPLPSKPRMVELIASRQPITQVARYVIRRGDLEVEFGDNYRDETLRRLLGMLAAC